jgi:alpha-tubulin suppressor-like RCC1 family protein
VSTSGRVYAWGACFGWAGVGPVGCNYTGYDSTTPNVVGATPVSVDYSSLLDASTGQVAQMSWKYGSAFLRTTNGALFAWGENFYSGYTSDYGRLCLGVGATQPWYSSPQRVPFSTPILDIQQGSSAVSFLTSTGEIYSCGLNSGQFASGTLYMSVPFPVRANLSAIGLSATNSIAQWSVGSEHIVLLTSQNELWSWGAASGNGLGYTYYADLVDDSGIYYSESPRRVNQTLVLKGRKIVSIHASNYVTHVSAIPTLPDSNRTLASNSAKLRASGSALFEGYTLTTTFPSLETSQGRFPFTQLGESFFEVQISTALSPGVFLQANVTFPQTQETISNVQLAFIVPRAFFSTCISALLF